ncbi:MAG: hypothetical protein JXB33_09885 [Clostridia bacterium]|nr:hypothetical protein [Clostridia bacterium]
MILWDGYKTETDSLTGRRIIQLTYGDAFCYPLYYFIPSVTEDEKYLVFHRMDAGGLQLYSLELATGKSTRITDAAHPDTRWVPWCSPTPPGVLDHRSALDAANRRVVYFDGNLAKATPVDEADPRILFSLDDDRLAMGQNCITPDGKWFVYIHHDKKTYLEMTRDTNWPAYYKARASSFETIITAYGLDSGESREILRINSPVHHVFPYGNRHFVVNHPVNENGMLFVPFEGGWYTNLRSKDTHGRMPCHCAATLRGITYEAYLGHSDIVAGILNPFTHERKEFGLPRSFGYVHTGNDPEGKLFFYENMNYDETGTINHDMHYVESFQGGGANLKPLLANRPSYIEKSQKSHFHPRMTPGRDYIIFTGGCPKTRTNHVYLLDVSDIGESKGLNFPCTGGIG